MAEGKGENVKYLPYAKPADGLSEDSWHFSTQNERKGLKSNAS